MRTPGHFLTIAAFLTLLVGAAGAAGDSTTTDYQQQIDEWFEGRIERLTSDTGWLTLVGLFELDEGTHSFGSREGNTFKFPDPAPPTAGVITVEGGRIFLRPEPGVDIRTNGELFAATEMFPDTSEQFNRFTMGTITFYVIERSGPYYLRVKDTNSPYRKAFKGIERYPVDEKWRVAAHFERYPVPKSLRIKNVLGYDETIMCPGAIVFEHDGSEYSLEPIYFSGDKWELVFADATSGEETYGGGRSVDIAAPDADGKTYIDFNESYNPPCAFNPYATCPLPHPDNVLPFAVTAGEKAYAEGHH